MGFNGIQQSISWFNRIFYQKNNHGYTCNCWHIQRDTYNQLYIYYRIDVYSFITQSNHIQKSTINPAHIQTYWCYVHEVQRTNRGSTFHGSIPKSFLHSDHHPKYRVDTLKQPETMLEPMVQSWDCQQWIHKPWEGGFPVDIKPPYPSISYDIATIWPLHSSH